MVTEHAFEQLMTGYFQSGLVGDPTETSHVFADSTGMHIKFRAGKRAVVRGFAWHSGDTNVEKEIAPNTSGSTRVDLAVLRLDRAAWTVRAHIVQGTPGGGMPAVQQSIADTGEWDLVVAVVTVPTGTTTSILPSMVSGTPFYLGPQLVITQSGPHSSANDPNYWLRYAPNVDRLELVRPTGAVRLWDNSGETVLSASGGGWTGSLDTVVQRIGPWVWLRVGTYTRTGGNLSANMNSFLPGTIPAAMRHPSRDIQFIARTGGHDAARLRLRHANSANPGRIELQNHSGLNTGQFLMGSTVSWPVV